MRQLSAIIATLCFLGTLMALGCKAPATPTPAPTSTPSPTSTRAPIASAWNLQETARADAANLIELGDRGYRFPSDWKVASIDFLYQWSGLAQPIQNYQTMTRSGDSYRRGTDTVPSDNVGALVRALDHLYPVQWLLAGLDHTDDYPSWAVDIVGTDGQHIMLFSYSTANPGQAPWNVLIDRRLYAQYDGALSAPLARLFPVKQGVPGAMSYPNPGTDKRGQVRFATSGPPRQLTVGFSGLLPVSDGFSYTLDTDKHTIAGSIQGMSRIGGLTLGQISSLSQVKLTHASTLQVNCPVEPPPQSDRRNAQATWRFVCPVPQLLEDQAYTFPLSMRLATEQGKEMTLTGVLWGTAHKTVRPLALPLPAELANVLPQNGSLQDLLTDHVLYQALYEGYVEASNPLGGTRSGEALLLGQTLVAGKTVRYTLGAPFVVSDGKVTHWEMDRQTLGQLITSITALPLTRRLLDADPSLIINLSYAKSAPPPLNLGILSSQLRLYALTLRQCGTEFQLPSGNRPLVAFSFNGPWQFMFPGFALVDGKAVVSSLSLEPLAVPRSTLLPALLPELLDTGSSRAFQRIYFAPGSISYLGLSLPQDTTAEERAVYDKVAHGLPGKLSQGNSTYWTVDNISVVVTDDGRLSLTACP